MELKISNKERKTIIKVHDWLNDFFKESYKKGETGRAHGLDHIHRVTGIATQIALLEGHKPFLTVITALLFDLGRMGGDPRSQDSRHGQVSVEMTKDLLDSLDQLSEEDKRLIKNAMEDHSKHKEEIRQNYLVQIIIDSSLIENFGAIGVLSAAAHRHNLPLYAKEISTSREDEEIKTIYQDIVFRQNISPEQFYTDSARKLVLSRRKFRNIYIKQLENELFFSQGTYNKLMEE